MELSVLNIEGKDTGKKVKLSESVFGISPNEHAVYLDVKLYLANQRQGTHKTKERPEVSYSTRKLLKQKGTGGARHGSRKSNIYVGGGRVFGPQPRDYSFKLNKKLKALARKSVLAAKAQENAISVIEDFTFESPKTKAFANILSNLSLTDKKILLVLPSLDKNVILSGRNIQKVNITTVDNLNTYQLMNNQVLLLAESTIQKLNEL
jgi:large subunit ribosomal protein L4